MLNPKQIHLNKKNMIIEQSFIVNPLFRIQHIVID